MTRLETGFTAQLRKVTLDEAKAWLRERVPEAIDESHAILRDAASEYDYDVEPIIDSLEGPEFVRGRDRVVARWGWEHEASLYFEFGTDDHTIQGQPVLSWVWDRDDAPDWVAREFDREGDGYRVFFREVEVSGVNELRFARDALRALERDLR